MLEALCVLAASFRKQFMKQLGYSTEKSHWAVTLLQILYYFIALEEMFE